MRRLLCLLLLALLPFAAPAAEGRKYAVLSLAGDRLLVAQREMSTGSRLDRNTREWVELPDNSIDRAIVLAVDDALRRAHAGAQTVLLASRRGSMYAAADRAARDGAMGPLFEAVRPALAGTGATHLVLVTKLRHRAMLRLRDGYVGSGFLEGVGFYVDRGSFARSVDPNEAESGFIAAFAYLRVALLDARSGAVLAEERVLGSEAATPGTRNVGIAWRSLSEQEKVERLVRVIRDEVQGVRLLAQAPGR